MRGELAVDRLDLEPIKYKLVVGGGWSREKADQVERGYKCFLRLTLRHPGDALVPLGDIDAFWHQHILDTRQYALDCDAIFGRFLHHYPYFGLRGEEDACALKSAALKTARLFSAEFGIELRSPQECAAPCQPGGTCGDQHCEAEPDSDEITLLAKPRPRFETPA